MRKADLRASRFQPWGEPVPQNAEDASALAAKGRRMLERYKNSKDKD